MDQILDLEEKKNTNFTYAGFWLRFVAIIIDGILLWIVRLLINLALGAPNESGFFVFKQEIDFFSAASILNLVINLVYFSAMESSSYQGTLGKMALGLKVVTVDGEPVTFARALGRNAAKWINIFTILIGYMMAGFTEKKQGLHDMIAKTLVVMK